MFLGIKQRRCPICANKKRGKYAIKNNYLDSLLLNSEDGKDYQWKEIYKNNNKIKHKIEHLICKSIFKIRPNDFQQGYRCPICAENNNCSYNVFYIKKFLTENNIPFKTEVTFKDCFYKNKLKFDFFIKINEKKILIEYDGQQHFFRGFDGDLSTNQKIRDGIKNKFISDKRVFFIRFHYKLDLKIIINLIKKLIDGKLDKNFFKLIKENFIYFQDNEKNLHNKKLYYTNLNPEYFNS